MSVSSTFGTDWRGSVWVVAMSCLEERATSVTVSCRSGIRSNLIRRQILSTFFFRCNLAVSFVHWARNVTLTSHLDLRRRMISSTEWLRDTEKLSPDMKKSSSLYRFGINSMRVSVWEWVILDDWESMHNVLRSISCGLRISEHEGIAGGKCSLLWP